MCIIPIAQSNDSDAFSSLFLLWLRIVMKSSSGKVYGKSYVVSWWWGQWIAEMLIENLSDSRLTFWVCIFVQIVPDWGSHCGPGQPLRTGAVAADRGSCCGPGQLLRTGAVAADRGSRCGPGQPLRTGAAAADRGSRCGPGQSLRTGA